MKMEKVHRNSRKMIAQFILPEEIYVEIISWLEVKPLLRCKCVCKRWKAVIEHKKFADMRMKCNRGKYHYIKCQGKSPNLDGIEETFEYPSNCDGLLIEKRSIRLSSIKLPDKFRVINPSTKQIIDLPSPRQKVLDKCIYFQSSTWSYNVVSIYCEKGYINIEVIDLGNGTNGNLVWRTINISRSHNLYLEKRRSWKRKWNIKSTRDGIHFCRMLPCGSSNKEIISVNIENEACTTCNVPPSLLSKWERVLLVIWNDKPSLLCVWDERVDIWVLEDYRTQKWAKTKIVISLPCMKKFPNRKMFQTGVFHLGTKDLIIHVEKAKSDDQSIWFTYDVNSSMWCETIKSKVYTIKLPETFVTFKIMQKKEYANQVPNNAVIQQRNWSFM